MESNLTYEQAYNELQGIVEKLQSNEVQIDQLSELVKRSQYLLKFCKTKLRSTETEIEELLKGE